MNIEKKLTLNDNERQALDDILDNPDALRTKKSLEQLKRQLSKKYHLSRYLANSHIILRARERVIDPKTHPWLARLNKKPSRSLSGVSIVAVMIPPKNSCPFDCAYCPSAENAPRSYIGHEPSTLRAISFNYDPFAITKHRIEQLRAMGHPANKIHIVVQGGTFLALSKPEQDYIMKGIYDGILAVDLDLSTNPFNTSSRPTSTLDEAIQRCETSPTRNVGTTFETRPDVCKRPHVDRMLYLGGTWVEIGVQTLSDDIYQKVNRGHTIQDVKTAFQLSRDAGYKISAHMMPNLLSTPELDIQMFRDLFSDPDLRPDGMKIYPLLILPGARLYDDWKNGHLNPTPYSDEELIRVLATVKDQLPSYTRIHRIQRDIPEKYVEGGLQIGNLRNIVKDFMDIHGLRCHCIRCREIGHVLNNIHSINREEVSLSEEFYDANKGKEYFLSWIEQPTDILHGFLRLRFPSPQAHRPEITPSTALVRELHVYGQEVPIGSEPTRMVHSQHRGLGRLLLERAEEIAISCGYDKMVVISGIGVRDYYRKFGYISDGPYVSKKLK